MNKKHKTVLSHQEKMAEFHAKIQTAVSVATLAPVCSVCQQAMHPPTEIYNCYNGHLVCATCKDKVTTCSICCQAIMGRATAMEQMIRSLLKMNEVKCITFMKIKLNHVIPNSGQLASFCSIKLSKPNVTQLNSTKKHTL